MKIFRSFLYDSLSEISKAEVDQQFNEWLKDVGKFFAFGLFFGFLIGLFI